jgi:hypothetical protein
VIPIKSLPSDRVPGEVGGHPSPTLLARSKHSMLIFLIEVSVTTLLQCTEPLFRRMVVLSGSCLLRRPVTLDTHEQFYLRFCKAQGFEGISKDDRIRAIEDRDSLELLLTTPPSVPSLPALDHDFLKVQTSFEKAKQWSNTQQPVIPGLKWCKEIVFGDCESDVRSHYTPHFQEFRG